MATSDPWEIEHRREQHLIHGSSVFTHPSKTNRACDTIGVIFGAGWPPAELPEEQRGLPSIIPEGPLKQ